MWQCWWFQIMPLKILMLFFHNRQLNINILFCRVDSFINLSYTPINKTPQTDSIRFRLGILWSLSLITLAELKRIPVKWRDKISIWVWINCHRRIFTLIEFLFNLFPGCWSLVKIEINKYVSKYLKITPNMAKSEADTAWISATGADPPMSQNRSWRHFWMFSTILLCG